MLYCKHRRRLDAMHWILKHKGKGECIENNGGKTLSYDANQGIRILEIDGYAFKDINGNGELDVFEDWRCPLSERIKDFVESITFIKKKGYCIIHMVSLYCQWSFMKNLKVSMYVGLSCS